MAITRRDYEAGRYQAPLDELPLEADWGASAPLMAAAIIKYATTLMVRSAPRVIVVGHPARKQRPYY